MMNPLKLFKKIKHNIILRYRFERYVDYLNRKYYGEDYKEYQFKAYPSDDIIVFKDRLGYQINFLNTRKVKQILKSAFELEKALKDNKIIK